MILRCIVALFLGLWASAAMAQPSDPPPVIAHDGLLALIESGEVDRVEEIMIKTRDLVRSGEASTNDWRLKYRAFRTTNPKAAHFAQDWLAQYPNSPFAHAAQAWVLFTIGGYIRGDKFNRDTYPEALQIYSQMYNEAYEHALFAFEAEDILTPASDALIKLGQWLGRREEAFEVLDYVMEIQPDWGTLRRGVDLATPNFGGGGSEMAYAICDYYGPKLSWPVKNMAQYCIASANSSYFGDRWDDVREWIKDDPDPIWDYYRVQSLLGATLPTEEETAHIVEYFKTSGSGDVRLADKFDLNYASLPGGEPISDIVLERAKDYARETLTYDPYNLYSLGILLRMSFVATDEGDGKINFNFTGSPTPAEAVEYNRLRILASPFVPEYWAKYAASLNQMSRTARQEPKRLFDQDPLLINAIVYSNHKPQQVFHYIDQKMLQHKRLQVALQKNWPDGWEELSAEMDEYESIICPVIRATRLNEVLIAEAEISGSFRAPSDHYEDQIADFRTAAKNEGECVNEETALVEDLLYTPIDVDLIVPDWAQDK